MTDRHVWRLSRRPSGDIADGDLAYTVEAAAPLADGQFALQIIYLSLDPTNRIWMSDQEQYMPPVGLGDPMRGGVCGRVVDSRKAGVETGQLFSGIGEWTDLMITDGTGLSRLPEIPGLALADVFGTLGLVGPTAYFGLIDVAQPKAGETLVVSGGGWRALAQVVGQIGKILGRPGDRHRGRSRTNAALCGRGFRL